MEGDGQKCGTCTSLRTTDRNKREMGGGGEETYRKLRQERLCDRILRTTLDMLGGDVGYRLLQ